MDTLFSNITAVTMIDKLPVILGAYVGVTDGKISYISKEPPKEEAARVIDGRGMVLMPGLINCHAHLPMTPLRGYGDDHDLQDWLTNYIFPKEDLFAAVDRVVDRLLERAPLALRGIKAIVSHAIVDGNIDVAHEIEKKLSIYLMSTDDFKEAVSAFEEHRKPEFQGK